jgi:hypothetical protein
MHIQPMLADSNPPEPLPPLAKVVEINRKEEDRAENSQLDPHQAARPQQGVLGREGAVGNAQPIIIEAIHCECRI